MSRARILCLTSTIALAGAACTEAKEAPGEAPSAPQTPRPPAPAPPAPATPAEPEPEAPLPAEVPVDAAAAQQLVDAWLAAQNADDFAAYEKLYAARMEGVKRAGPRTRRFDRAGWLADRKKMFDGKPMQVAVRDLTIAGSAAAPTLRFVQSFQQGKFADEGPKQIVLTRGPGGALQITREEMLASSLGRVATTQGPVALILALEGKHHVVIATDADPAWGRGPLRGPLGDAPMLATRSAADAPQAAAWTGKTIAVYSDKGERCDATVGALRLVGGGTPHFGEVQVWNGDPAMSPDGRVWSRAERARAVFGMGALYLVGELAIAGACAPAYATDAAAKVTPFAAAPLPGARATAALAAFRALPAYAEIQRTWKDEFAGKDEWVAAPQMTEFVAGERRYVVASAHEGTGCGAFEGALTAVFADEAGTLTLISDPAEGALRVDAMVDGDGDGKPEIVGGTGDWSVSSAYLTPSAGGFSTTLSLTFPFRDCGC